ncbi:hypothetical protein MKZ38_001680 [Zalerion maritima]|uniref:C2H2-type domain-containing protein n=1 Tax=Zalerion maritima TaxID=339359 RepID=A0AAD5RQW6_9PEZI|nr:hypothetical protein MKZ38_001680 [Zalerion maritima]
MTSTAVNNLPANFRAASSNNTIGSAPHSPASAPQTPQSHPSYRPQHPAQNHQQPQQQSYHPPATHSHSYPPEAAQSQPQPQATSLPPHLPASTDTEVPASSAPPPASLPPASSGLGYPPSASPAASQVQQVQASAPPLVPYVQSPHGRPPPPPPPPPPGAHYHISLPSCAVHRPSPALQGHPSKPPIMDPPSSSYTANKSSSHQQSASGFPSPSRQHSTINPKFNEDKQRMDFAVGQCVPEAVRRVVRDNWEKCLLGSEFHQAFILNASIHHTSGQIIRRSVKDFGSRMVSEAKDEFIKLFTTTDLDAVASAILEKASSSFLDKALEERLQTIEARPLINALANAGRLGYDPNDVVDEKNNERVFPSQKLNHVPGDRTTDGRWNCRMCGRYFQAESAYEHHAKKYVCQRQPPNANGFSHSCPYCGQGFTTIVGLQYHNANNVCGDFSQPIKPTSHTTSVTTSPANHPFNGGSVMITARPSDQSAQAAQFQQTPVNPRDPLPANTSSPATNTPVSNGKYSSSYDHLSPANKNALIDELRQAELKYGERIKVVEAIADPEHRLNRLEAIKNGFSTKQSMIRKKYGVRLRERRSKFQMDQERSRLGIQTASMMSNAAIQKAMAEIKDGSSPAPDGARQASGWTAANAQSAPGEDTHSNKRQRAASGSVTTSFPSHEEYPRRRGLAVTEMGGGLGNSTATVSMQDPTTMMNTEPPTPSQGRTMASVRAAGVRMSGGNWPHSSNHEPRAGGAVKSEAVAIDSDTDQDDVESSDDDDIPAEAPSGSQKAPAKLLHV